MATPMGKDVMKRCLGAVPLFADVPEAELDALVAATRSVWVKKGARIFEEGAVADCCYVLTTGRARVALAGNSGTEILLHIVTPMGLVGEIALLDRSTRSASLVAVEPCHLIRIPATALDMLRRNPAFEQRLMARVVLTLRESDARMRVVSSFPSVSRVAWCLGRIARYSGRREGGAIVIPTPAQNDLAEMAGCTRETVSRALQALKRRKCVIWDRETMRLDVEALQRYLVELTAPNRFESSPQP